MILPPELVQGIVFAVLLDSIHFVALAAPEADWETNVFSTLASVSYTFRELTVGFAHKAFSIPEDTQDVISIAESKLKALHREITPKSAREADCNLLKAYVLFVAVRGLWINSSSDAPPNIFLLTEHCLQAASTVMLQLCREAATFPMTRLLARCVEQLREMAGHARVLVGSTAAVDEFVLKWKTADETDRETLLQLLKTLVDTLVGAEHRYSLLATSNLIGLPNFLPSARLPGLLNSLSKLCDYEQELGPDVRLIHDRVANSELETKRISLAHSLARAV